jgi:hypothetical protein
VFKFQKRVNLSHFDILLCIQMRVDELSSSRASTIELTQLAIRIKIIYLCLVGGERGGERGGVDSNAKVSSSTCS